MNPLIYLLKCKGILFPPPKGENVDRFNRLNQFNNIHAYFRFYRGLFHKRKGAAQAKKVLNV